MKDRTREWVADQGPIGCLAWSLLIIAAAASFDHWHSWAEDHGQVGLAAVAIALLPDLLTWAALSKLRGEVLGGLGKLVVALVLFVTAYATLAVNYSTAKAPAGQAVGDGERLAAMAPVIGAILATLLAEIRGPRRDKRKAKADDVVQQAPSEHVTAPAVVDDVVRMPSAPWSAPVPVMAADAARAEVTEHVPDDDTPVRPGERSDAEMLAAALAAIAAGDLPPDPSGNQLRGLGMGPVRAKRIKAMLEEGATHG